MGKLRGIDELLGGRHFVREVALVQTTRSRIGYAGALNRKRFAGVPGRAVRRATRRRALRPCRSDADTFLISALVSIVGGVERLMLIQKEIVVGLTAGGVKVG